MATLSLPDVRDYASLKYEKLDWIVEPAQLKGLRVGLLLEAGCGAAPTPEVKAAVERAAKDFEAAGAHVEPLKPFLTQEMLDGLDRFWRARALSDISALPAERRALVLPFIRDWAESAAGFSGVEVFRGFDRIPEMRKAAVAATQGFDCVLSPTADDRLSRRMALSQPRPAASVSASRFHRRLQHVRAAGGVGQLRLRFRWPADRVADRRSPV
jgi:aspartyl-tRNA(Asn)/glutamyl-tRNA(Gln) amidotransferase subunit A